MGTMGPGWLETGLSLSYARRTSLRSGTTEIDNPDGRQTSARIYALETGLGIWRGLSARVVFPILDASFDMEHESGREIGVGDLALTGRYQFSLPMSAWSLAIGGGFYLPTGGKVSGSIPSNPNFISGTVDPVLSVDAGYEFVWGLGFYMQGFSRLVAYDNSDGYRAGHSLVYGGGVRYRLWRSLLPSVGLLALHRLNDTKQGAEVSDAGGDWLYLTPGLGYMVLKGPLAGLSLNIVGQIPLFQHLNGTQLAEDFSLSFAVAYGFQLFGAPVTD